MPGVLKDVSNIYVTVANLRVHKTLYDFIVDEALPDTGLSAPEFWQGFSDLVKEFSTKNKALLLKRDQLQEQIDAWHQARAGTAFDASQYKAFLADIGYLVAPGEDFSILTENVDDAIAVQAGPQLVVPVMNARFALNACNARWGSLYDALYGTDVIDENDGAEKQQAYNPIRGQNVIEFGRDFLNSYFPLLQGDFKQLKRIQLDGNKITFQLVDGSVTQLKNSEQWLGYTGTATEPQSFLFCNNGLRIEVQIDPSSTIGSTDLAAIKDIVLESALTTIMDCEDSVAAVDAEDKTLVYRNWLGLMKGTLTETVTKNGKSFVRSMNPDREFFDPQGEVFIVPGRSLMFVRNVGHLMTTPAVLDEGGHEIPEGIMDGLITSLAAMHDLNKNSQVSNSTKGSVYIVKPKMHGPEEVAFTDSMFEKIESILGLKPYTLKVGIMDEERRTSINLKECIRAAQHRVAFINTGFLDRTGDEIHTSMEAGAFAPKDKIKAMPWIQAYELNNVASGLECGLKGRAQIGKGMWAMPDNMAEMMRVKIGQPLSGANTAWVPSPTAATLHAIHYHQVNVAEVQANIELNSAQQLDGILNIPLLDDTPLSNQMIQKELENNIQGILGYVVRWIDQGIGCSKVPDITNTQLMEDRATLRISSQHICNWLYYDICTEQQVLDAFNSMAKVVDQQNEGDPLYRPMADNLHSNVAFSAAKDLVFKGREQPNGYTEPLLHAYRLKAKS